MILTNSVPEWSDIVASALVQELEFRSPLPTGWSLLLTAQRISLYSFRQKSPLATNRLRGGARGCGGLAGEPQSSWALCSLG